MRNQRGFSLTELLVVLLILTIITGGIYRLLNNTQRLTRAQTEKIDLQSNVRTASILIPAELREINTFTSSPTSSRTDITAGTETSITYRAMRTFGLLCGGSTPTSLRVIKSSVTGSLVSNTVGGTGIYVFDEGASSDFASDDGWDSGTITSVTAGTCSTGEEAWIVAVTNLTSPGGVATPQSVLLANTPVRSFEVMVMGLYASGGQYWLGLQKQSAGGVMEPIVGPLQQTTGVQFKYLDASGTAVTTPTAAQMAATKSILVTINGVSSQAVSKGGGNTNQGYLYEQISTQVSLRNALR